MTKSLHFWLLPILLTLFGVLLWWTVVASFDRSVADAVRALWPDPWFKATLIDFYNNQFLIFLWIAYKERTWMRIIIYGMLSIGLGSFTSIGYVLYQFYRHRDLAAVITKRTSV